MSLLEDARLQYRSLSFRPPRGWLTTSACVLGDARSAAGFAFAVEERPLPPGEPLSLLAARITAELPRSEILEQRRITVDGELAVQIHLSQRSDALALGKTERVLVFVAAPRSRTLTVLSCLAPASGFAAKREAFERFLRSVRLDDGPVEPPRVRPLVASFEPPPGLLERASWSMFRASPAFAALVVRLEPRPAGVSFADALRAREGALTQEEILESVPMPPVAGRAVHRLRWRQRDLEQLSLVVDAVDGLVAMSVAAPPRSPSLVDAEEVLRELAASVRVDAVHEAPLVQGFSVQSLELLGKTPEEVHTDLLQRAFSAARVPLSAPTTREGERQFLTVDGRRIRDPNDPQLACEWIYSHADGGRVRVFPHGHRSPGLGSAALGPCARRSITAPGARDFGLDAEIGAVVDGGLAPRTVAVEDGLETADPELTAQVIRHLARASWTRLSAGRTVALPIVERPGLRLGRTIVPRGDFGVFARRVERVAAGRAPRRRDIGGNVQLDFIVGIVEVGFASLTVDFGSEVLAVEPVGYAASVEELGYVLRRVLRGERYHVYDDATGDDVTATVMRIPSFLVAPTRRRPLLFGLS